MEGEYYGLRLQWPIPDRPKRIILVNNEEKAQEAVRKLLRYDVLGFDTETYNARERHVPAFNPVDGARIRLSQWATPDGEVFVFDHYRVSKNYLYSMFPNKTFMVVGQNLVFDLTFVMWELGIYEFGDLWDTMIAGQIINKGKVAGQERIPVGLDAIARRELDVVLPKDEQSSAWYMNELSLSQIEYSARDAIIVLAIWQKQRDRIIEQSQMRAAEIDFGVVPPVAWMKNNGIVLNKNKWEAQYNKLAAQIEKVKDRLWELLGIQGTLFGEGPTINLNSKPQVIQSFLNQGITLPIHPKTGELTLSAELLKPIEHFESVRLYIEYVGLAKKLSSYGMNWIDAVNIISGRLHGSLKIIGAETGRMAGVTPNLMQVPKEDEYRNCFEATEGWVLVDTDYSQCELRILAEFSRDPKLLEAFDNDYDLHRFSAHLIYKKAMEDVDKKERGIAKNLNFGIVYGIGSGKFAMQSHLPVDEAQAIMDYYLKEAYPGMSNWLESRARSVMAHLQARTMSGRLRQYTGDITQNEIKAKIQRNAKNMPIQGTNADITKRALRLLYDRVIQHRNKFRMLLPVHDEALSESEPSFAREGAWIQEQAMLQAEREFLKRVPCKVDTTITRVWCKEPNDEQKAEAEALLK